VDIDTPSDHCEAFGTQRRFILQGPNTLKQFMDWLLDAEVNDRGDVSFKHQEAIVIAHNFKGYDGQFNFTLSGAQRLYQTEGNFKREQNLMHGSLQL
jgi:hypothetical protein